MSYVLEALKKAQAQREQGAVPGIHSVQIPYVAVPGKVRTQLKPMLWVIAMLLVVVVALLTWRMDTFTQAKQEPVPVVVQSATPQVAAVPAPLQTPSPVLESMPTPAVVPKEDPSPAGEVQAPPAAKEEPAAAQKKEQKERPQRKQAANQPTYARRIYLVSELPEAVRRELPALAISGGSYSSNPAQRLIIVNNQVFTEGSQPMPGVVVQRIEPSAAVLSFQGYWYRLGY